MPFSHHFDATVLREYDIRGIVGRTLHTADAFAIGRCFGTLVARACFGQDGSASSAVAHVDVAQDGGARSQVSNAGVSNVGVSNAGVS